jgi:hypothetical protein
MNERDLNDPIIAFLVASGWTWDSQRNRFSLPGEAHWIQERVALSRTLRLLSADSIESIARRRGHTTQTLDDPKTSDRVIIVRIHEAQP